MFSFLRKLNLISDAFAPSVYLPRAIFFGMLSISTLSLSVRDATAMV